MADTGRIGVSGCHYHPGVTCSAGSRDCKKCGFNPDSETRKRRIEIAMRDYQEKVERGEVIQPWW